ncbi:replication/maintenance protein RepL [Klebsiella pneumoniae]
MKKNKLVNKENFSILETLPEDPLFENKSMLEMDLNQFDLFNRVANEAVEELVIREINDPNDRSDKNKEGINLNAKVYVEKEKKTSLKKDFVITFVENLEALAKLNLKPNEFRIIVEIVKVMEYGNLINLSQSTIAKNLNLAKSNVSYYFKNLKKKNILVEKDGHVFMNSNIFSKGLAHRLDEEKRKNLRSAQVEDENFKNTF